MLDYDTLAVQIIMTSPRNFFYTTVILLGIVSTSLETAPINFDSGKNFSLPLF